MRIIYPDYICIILKNSSQWRIKEPSKIFWRSPNSSILTNRQKREETYGLKLKDLILPLFRKYLGKLGFYIVNMRDRQYYYCGLTWHDVQQKLWELGITQPEGK